jgi:hypothetical protein
MAQLIKLQDYISRYQVDLTRYPTQYIRLKKGQWERVKKQWEQGGELQQWEHIEEEVESASKLSVLRKFNVFSKRKKEQDVIVEDIESVDTSSELDSDEYVPDEETMLHFEANILYHPQSLQELKRMYLNQFFQFQMQWASSTLREKSYVDPRFIRDTFLRALLQTLPDNYLILYYPIVKLKKAPIELDIIIMMPTECLLITVVEQEDQAVFIGDGERFWEKKVGKESKKVLNPTIQLNRMETIVKQMFAAENVDMPIRKVLLSRNGFIDYPSAVYNIQLVDKRKFPEWMESIRKSYSPMKHMQIRAAQSVLNYVQTTSFNRDIWQTNIEAEDNE